MSEGQIRPNLLTVIPGNITIENFVPGRVYKETLMIYNTCNVPIVITLKTSDKSKLSISESKLRIGVNQAKKLDLLIQDKINYKYIKTPAKQKQLFIHMKGDLIDEKYEINLFYYDKNKTNRYQNNNNGQSVVKNNNIINPLANEYKNQIIMNKNYPEYPQGYYIENPNNFINRQNINNLNIEKYNNQILPNYHNENIDFVLENNNINENDKMPYIPLEQNDNEEVVSLKKIINELTEKVIYLQSLLENNQSIQKNSNKNNNNILRISHNSFYIFGTGFEKEIKEKYKLDDNIETQKIISKNKILELENSTLLYRIKCLEKKLSLYSKNINLQNEDNENNLIDVDANLEYNFEGKDYLEGQNNNNYLMNDNDNNNLNMERYKYLYEERKKSNNINNKIDFNNDNFEQNI